jgi:hypothetical protein
MDSKGEIQVKNNCYNGQKEDNQDFGKIISSANNKHRSSIEKIKLALQKFNIHFDEELLEKVDN